MDQRQVQLVLSVAEKLSFSEAAWENSYTASVVSKQVAALENELGVRIFERKGRSKVELTEIGKKLLPCLSKIQAEYNRMRNIASDAANGTSCIALSCPCGFSTLGEDELISIFSALYPEIIVRLLSRNDKACQELLLCGDADVSIRMLSDAQLEQFSRQKEMCCIKLADTQLGVVLRENHPAIQNGKVKLSALRDELFLFYAFKDKMDADPKIEEFQNACRAEGFEPHLRFSREIRPSAAFALAANGVCAIPLMHAPNVKYAGTCYTLFDRDYYSFSIVLIYLRSNSSPALKSFVRCASENLQLFSPSPCPCRNRGSVIGGSHPDK